MLPFVAVSYTALELGWVAAFLLGLVFLLIGGKVCQRLLNSLKRVIVHLRARSVSLNGVSMVVFVLCLSVAGVSILSALEVDEAKRMLLTRNEEKIDWSTVVTAKELIRRNSDAVFIDVRPLEDFQKCHIPQSLNVPAFAIKTKAFLKEKPLILVNEGYDFHELNSRLVQLKERNFENVRILAGGIVGWQQAGGSVTGDIFAAKKLAYVPPQKYFPNRNYADIKVFEISSMKGDATEYELFPQAAIVPLMKKHAAREALAVSSLANRDSARTLYALIIGNPDAISGNEGGFIEKIDCPVFFLDGGRAGYADFIDRQVKMWRKANTLTGRGCPTCP